MTKFTLDIAKDTETATAVDNLGQTDDLPNQVGQLTIPLFLKASARRYPPGTPVDTVIGVLINPNDPKATIFRNDLSQIGVMFFQPDEILSVLMTEYEVTGKIKGSIPYVKNSSGRHLIGQQGCRGCTAASVEMLIMDHGGEPSLRDLVYTNLGNSRTIIARLNKAGFSHRMIKLTDNKQEKLNALNAALAEHGPGELAVSCEIGGHSIVLDSIDLERNSAVVRDPFHFWQIEVALEALLERSPSRIIQVTGRITDGKAV